jgi:hypothetical protein
LRQLYRSARLHSAAGAAATATTAAAAGAAAAAAAGAGAAAAAAAGRLYSARLSLAHSIHGISHLLAYSSRLPVVAWPYKLSQWGRN